MYQCIYRWLYDPVNKQSLVSRLMVLCAMVLLSMSVKRVLWYTMSKVLENGEIHSN